jgi:hypothetical protein
VALQVYSKKVKVTGGTVIKVVAPRTATAWLKNYGLVAEKGVVVLFKAVRDNWHSKNGGVYTPGMTPVAEDWDGGAAECGGGLHFSPFPWMAQRFDLEATRFVGCPVRLSEIRKPQPTDMFPEKVKAKGCCGPVFAVDVDGNRLEKGTP